MNCISVLIPDADLMLNVARCLAASEQVVVHGLALRRASAMKHSRFFASFEELKDTRNITVDRWLGRIGEIVTERQIDVVLPTSDFGIRTLSDRRHTLDWNARLPPLPEPHAFDLATDKANLADFLVRCGLPHPTTKVISTDMPIHGKLLSLEFPVLLKPTQSSGGVGIRWFDALGELSSFLATRPRNERWIAQTFINGQDLSVNVLCEDGRILAATIQHVIQPSNEPFQPPAGLEFKNDPPAMKIVETLIRELGWSGVANIDMRFDTRRKTPVILELNGRYWRTLLGSLVAGVNFPLLACEMCHKNQNANRIPHAARYFYGREFALLSLIGGGRFHVRPYETNLRYFDPLFSAHIFAADARTQIVRVLSKVLCKLRAATTMKSPL